MRKLDSIESLRGWMAWWVVLGHAVYLSGTDAYFSRMPFKLLTANGYAVNVFMVISGFVIANLVIDRNESYLVYIARRGWRLFPLMAVMIAISALTRSLYYEAYLVNPWAPGAVERNTRFLAEEQDWPRYLLLHLTMLHGLIPEQVLRFSATTFLAPAWSISLEWQFYLVAPVLVRAMIVRSLRSACVVVVALSLSFASLSGAIGTWQYESFMPLAIVYFMIGITLRTILERDHNGLPTLWQPVVVTCLALIIYAATRPLSNAIFDLALLTCLSLPFFLIAAVEAEVISCESPILRRIAWLLALNPVSVALGRVSYSTYLCHIPVITIVVGGAILITGNTSHASIIGWTVLAVVLVVPASFLAYRWIEAPALAFGRNYLFARHRWLAATAMRLKRTDHV